MHTLLTIAGFDPSCGAGITADLAVFNGHGCFGTACITALTVQSTRGVESMHPVGAAHVQATLAALTQDLPPAGIKLGMLGDGDTATAVADFLDRVPRAARPVLVLDPVLRASSGHALLDVPGAEVVRTRLCGMADWVTPNRAELAVLTGLSTAGEAETLCAALALQKVHGGSLGVVATGGDGETADDLVLYPQQPPGEPRWEWFRAPRIDSRSTHGTGCAFSSALLCGLVAGVPAREAAWAARQYVRIAIGRAVPLGQGRGPLRLDWRAPLEPCAAVPPYREEANLA